MLRSLAVLALLTLPLACSKAAQEPVTPPAQAGTSSPPRFDGVYAAPVGKPDQGQDQGMDLLRFVADGRVLSLSVSSSQGLEPAVRMLLAENEKCATGKYEIKDGVLRFVLKSKLGSVEYAGAVREDKLLARWRSGINGTSLEETFSFVHVVEDEKGEKNEKPTAAAPDGEPSGPASPELALIPEGAAWFCFRAPSVGVSRCERKAAECDAARKTTAAAHKNLKLTPCAKQASAHCFTIVQKSAQKGAASCSATEDDCKAEVAGLGAEGADVSVSACTKQ